MPIILAFTQAYSSRGSLLFRTQPVAMYTVQLIYVSLHIDPMQLNSILWHQIHKLNCESTKKKWRLLICVYNNVPVMTLPYL